MAKILVFGDSNSHGTKPLDSLGAFERYPRGTPWPDVMAKATGHDVITEGLPGRTTVHDDLIDGGARNGAMVLPAILGSHVPLDLIVLMLGTNDLKPRFATSAIDIALSMQRLITLCRAQLPEVQILVIAPPPVRETGCLAEVFAGAEVRQRDLDAQLETVAKRADVAFLRAGDHIAVSSIDGVHWDAAAHATLGQAVADLLAPLLPAPPKASGALQRPEISAEPPMTLDRTVPPDWVDYNGHMNEAFYLTAATEATDQLLDWAGMDAQCIAEGFSIFTVETHIRHLAEVAIGDRLTATTRVMEGGGKRLHVWSELSVAGKLCATVEQLLLHMDLTTRRVAEPRGDVAAWLSALKEAHADLPMPEGLGRCVAQPR